MRALAHVSVRIRWRGRLTLSGLERPSETHVRAGSEPSTRTSLQGAVEPSRGGTARRAGQILFMRKLASGVVCAAEERCGARASAVIVGGGRQLGGVVGGRRRG